MSDRTYGADSPPPPKTEPELLGAVGTPLYWIRTRVRTIHHVVVWGILTVIGAAIIGALVADAASEPAPVGPPGPTYCALFPTDPTC
jgi:hypothetical protein